jgi:hypothetical protein
MSGAEATICSVNVMVPIYSTFCKKREHFTHIWRLLITLYNKYNATNLEVTYIIEGFCRGRNFD